MAHVRQQIREAAVTALGGVTDAGSSVHKSSRTDPFVKGFGSAIRVSAPEEESAVLSMGRPAVIQREITLRIAYWAEGGDELDDQLDTAASQIETAIQGTGAFGGLAKSVTLTGTGPVIDAEGAKRAGTIALDFTVRVMTREDDPDTAI